MVPAMSNRIETAQQEVMAALAAINAFLDSEQASTVDAIYRRHMAMFRHILSDMLASLERSGDFVPVADRNMGYPIVDSWPLPHQSLDETKAALAAIRTITALSAARSSLSSRTSAR